MSFCAILTAIDTILKSPELSSSAKLTLIMLANRHNQNTGRLDPSVSTIAKDAGISIRAVKSALRELEAAGIISTVHRTVKTGLGKRNLNNRYRIRGSAKSAPGVGQNLHTKQEDKTPPKKAPKPSAFDDLAMIVEAPEFFAMNDDTDDIIIPMEGLTVPGMAERYHLVGTDMIARDRGEPETSIDTQDEGDEGDDDIDLIEPFQ